MRGRGIVSRCFIIRASRRFPSLLSVAERIQAPGPIYFPRQAGQKVCRMPGTHGRETRPFSPVSRKAESQRRCKRKKSAHAGNSFPAWALLSFKWGLSLTWPCLACGGLPSAPSGRRGSRPSAPPTIPAGCRRPSGADRDRREWRS